MIFDDQDNNLIDEFWVILDKISVKVWQKTTLYTLKDYHYMICQIEYDNVLRK